MANLRPDLGTRRVALIWPRRDGKDWNLKENDPVFALAARTALVRRWLGRPALRSKRSLAAKTGEIAAAN